MIGLFAALIAPYYIDWSVYKRDFEREASRIIGQTVTVAGGAKLRLLPMPGVTFEGLKVGQNDDGSPIATVDEFSLRAELMPFLKGQIRIRDMKLVRPTVQVHVTPDGQVAWTNRKQAVVDPDKVNLDNLSVEEGKIIVSGLAGGREFVAEDLYAAISASTLLGPWKIDASGQVAGVQARWSVSTGILQPSGSIRVKLTNEQVNLPYKLLVDGPLQLRDGVVRWGGEFSITPLAGDALARARDASPPLEAYVEGIFEATPRQIDVSEYRLEVGSREDPYTVSGSGGIDIGDKVFFKLLADGRQIDLDRIGKQEADKSRVSVQERIALLRSVLEAIPVPPVDGVVSLELPAIVAGDTLIRKISAKASPVERGWNVQKFDAVLPGNTIVNARGRLDLFKDFGFNGNLLMASRQPSGFAAWIAGEVAPSVRRLSSAGFEANVTLSPNQISMDQLELVLDKATLRGSLQRLGNEGGRPGIIAALEGDRINADDLRAIYALTQGNQNASFANHDVDFNLKTKHLEGKAFGEKLSGREVDMHFRVQEGSLTIERLKAGDFFGASISSSGRVTDLLSHPHGNIKVKLAADNLAELSALALRLGAKVPVLETYGRDASLTQNTALDLELDATSNDGLSKGVVLLTGISGQTRINSTVGFEGYGNAIGQTEFDIVTTMENAVPHILFNQLGAQVLPLDAPGPLKITSELKGQLGNDLEFQISASAPQTDLSAKGRGKRLFEENRSAEFDFTLGTTDFQPFLTLAGYVVPGVTLFDELPASVSSKIAVKGKDLAFSDISGQVSNNQLKGDVQVRQLPATRPKLFGKLTLDKGSLPLIGAMVYGQLEPGLGQLAASDGEASFSKSALQGLDGELSLSFGEMELGFGEPAADFTTSVVMLDGGINLNNSVTKWLGGELSGNLSFQNTDGTGLVSGQYQLLNGDLKSLTEAAGVTADLKGEFSASGTFDGSGRSHDGLVSGLSGSGIINIKKGELQGINPQAFPQILLASDVEGFEISAARVGEFVEEIVLDGQFGFENYSEAYSLVNGNLQLRNMSLQLPGLKLSGQGSVNLVDAEAEAELRLVYDPGKEAVAGASPEVRLAFEGPVNELERHIGTQGLEGFLSIRAYEREQRRVELLQVAILEKQRLRRETLRTNARQRHREYLAEQARLKAEAEAAAEAERLKLEAEAAEEQRKLDEIERVKREKEEAARAKKEAAEAAEQAKQAKLDEEKRKQEEARLAAERQKNAEQKKADQRAAVANQDQGAAPAAKADPNAVIRRDLAPLEGAGASAEDKLNRELFLKQLDDLLLKN